MGTSHEQAELVRGGRRVGAMRGVELWVDGEGRELGVACLETPKAEDASAMAQKVALRRQLSSPHLVALLTASTIEQGWYCTQNTSHCLILALPHRLLLDEFNSRASSRKTFSE
jgi:hypothetical protein